MFNTINPSVKPLIFFENHDGFNARLRITARDNAELMRLNAYITTSFSYFNEKKKNSWEYEIGIVDVIERLYDRVNQVLPIGLIPRCVNYFRTNNFDVRFQMSEELKAMYKSPIGEVTEESISEFCETLDLKNRDELFKITPYKHQIRLVTSALNYRRCSLLACTSAGKSLSIYIITRWLMEKELKKKILIVTPSSALVKQLYDDFSIDYCWENAKENCTLVYGESEDAPNKKTKKKLEELNLGEEVMLKNVVISTWQSLKNKSDEYLSVFDAVIVDEAHSTRGPVLRDILFKCKSALNFKIGVSGTLPDEGLDAALIESSMGRKEVVVRAKELIDLGILTPVQIYSIKVPYEQGIRSFIHRQKYQDEYLLVTNNGSRKAVMDMLIDSGNISRQENTVVLFKSLDSLEAMYSHLSTKYTDFTYFTVKGDIPADERNAMRAVIEKKKGCIVLATYGTMKQGVNIKLLHNLVFAEFSKSMYEVVQSIGRVLRPHKEKKIAKVFDIFDDASYWTKPRKSTTRSNLKLNYSYAHYEARKDIYFAEDYPISEISLEGYYEATVVPEMIDVRREKAASKKTSKKKAETVQKTSGIGKKSQFNRKFY